MMRSVSPSSFHHQVLTLGTAVAKLVPLTSLRAAAEERRESPNNPEARFRRWGRPPSPPPSHSHLVLVQQGPSVRVAVEGYSCKRQVEKGAHEPRDSLPPSPPRLCAQSVSCLCGPRGQRCTGKG